MQSAEKDVLIGFVGGGDKEGDAAVQVDGSAGARTGRLRCCNWNEGTLRGIELDCFGLNRFPLILSLMGCREGAV